jgi:uncharacterized repeat protein (TIGR01451 family)
MLDRQPASFFVSLPLRTLVVHPFRPDFSNDLLPKLHAELWSDWFGYLHGGWATPTRLERVTGSMQSVLGLAADALAVAGLLALALPALVRAVRRREANTPLAVLALLAVVSFAAFVVMLLRFPQRYGDPIKTSYLLFTTPCWAVFSVAAWSWLRARSHHLHVALVGIAALYVASYGTDLGAALSNAGGPRSLGGAAGYVDLVTSFQQNSPTPGLGGTIDFLAGVENTGDQTASSLVLTVRLPPGLRLVGPPYHERGPGCVGTSAVRCDLDFLAGGSSTLIRYSVQVIAPGPQTMTAMATSAAPDARPGDNAATATVEAAPG